MGLISEELLRKFPEEKTEITVFNTKVVGTSFRKKEDIDAVEDGDFVLIRPELNNEHDQHACQVIHDETGNHIGYIRKLTENGTELSKEIWTNIIRQGDLYVGRVTVTGGTEGKQKGLNLEIRRLHLRQ